MFRRQMRSPPPVFFGQADYPARVRLLDDAEWAGLRTLRVTRDLGWMLHDHLFEEGGRPCFFRARMIDGIVAVPPLDDDAVFG